MGIGVPFAGRVCDIWGNGSSRDYNTQNAPRGRLSIILQHTGRRRERGGGLPAASGTGLTGTPAPLCLWPAGPEGKEAPGGKGEWQGRRHQWEGTALYISTSCLSLLLLCCPPLQLTQNFIFQENDENGEPDVDDEEEDEVDEEDEEDEGDGG